MNLTNTLSNSRATHFALRVLAVALLLVGGFALKGHPVSAATQNGVATISDPGNNQPLASGGSNTKFTVVLPANAACAGDTSKLGYHVFSYVVPDGTNVGGLTFKSFASSGYGLFDESGLYFGSVSTAIDTGQVIGIPTNFVWSPLVTNELVTAADLTGGASAKYDAGIVCANTDGVPSDWWNTEVTFTANAADANGFTWAATPGGGSAPAAPSTTTTVPKTRVTTTTKPHVTTTTDAGTGDPVTSTTVAGDPTSTTIVVSGAGDTPVTPVDASGDFPDPTATSTGGGTLPRTGSPVNREVGLGLLAIGAGMMIIGLEWRWKARGVFAA